MDKKHIEGMIETIMSAIKGCSDKTSLEDKIVIGLSYYWDDKFALTWTIDNVLERAKLINIDISKDEAKDILDAIYFDYDKNCGISWFVLDRAIQQHYIEKHLLPKHIDKN